MAVMHARRLDAPRRGGHDAGSQPAGMAAAARNASSFPAPMWISAGAIVAFTAAVFFSTKAIFVKLTYLYGADAITALALRMIMALPMLLAIAWYSTRQGARPLTRADWK